MTALPTLAHELLTTAHEAHSGRAAHTVYGGSGHVLRQTVIALVAGHGLDEHESPGDATLQVLSGRVLLHGGDETQEGTTGDHLVIPPRRHSLNAVEDSVVLLSVASGRPA